MRRVERPSPNHDDRGDAVIDMLVLHYTGMPGAPRLRHMDIDGAVFIDGVVRRYFRRWIAQPRQRLGRAFHAGIMQYQHVDHRVAAIILVG